MREGFAVVAVDGGDHPVTRGVGVSAADDVNVILASARGTEHGVAAPHGPRDNFRAVVAEIARDLGKKPS